MPNDRLMDHHWHSTLGSTNDEADRLAQDGAPHGTLVGTDYQQSGRGRGGNRWQCAPGEGLMCSILLRPSWDKPHWGWIALTAGLSLCELLERDCLTPRIKWPNDILINGRKIAGILTEAKQDYVIVGIGMNLNMRTLPEVTSDIPPTSFLLETDCTLDPASYARSIQSHLTGLVAADSPLYLRRQIEQRLAWAGQCVRLSTAQQHEHTGYISGLGDYGQLRLSTDGGQEQEIYDAYNIRPA